ILNQFEGTITQIPPMYSSVKVNGKKLYEYARNNEVVERPERQVNIMHINRTSELRFEDNSCHFEILVECGKGTYIRTLATDIGKALGHPAHMSKLTRIQSGGFDVDESLTLNDVAELHEHDALQEKLFPIEYGLKGLKQILISDAVVKSKILNGQKFYKNEFTETIDTIVALVDVTDNKVLAIYAPHPEKIDEIKPKKVFN
ncbi:MAG: tRNA pseudouridine(55) synthase TruB, partial [Staphylococcus equorum]|nr:tRNA pseudouridine(55) synthase TruB [Staphylococcus equorum]